MGDIGPSKERWVTIKQVYTMPATQALLRMIIIVERLPGM